MPHGKKKVPIMLPSDQKKKASFREIAKVLGSATSGPLMVFSCQTHISSFKLGLMLSV